MLSAGHIKTTAVPRQTTSPKFLVSSVILNGSSEAAVIIEYYFNHSALHYVSHGVTLHVLYGSIQN